jgi:sortase A
LLSLPRAVLALTASAALVRSFVSSLQQPSNRRPGGLPRVGILGATNRVSKGHSFRLWRIAEAVAWTAGVVLLLACGAWYVEGVTASRHAMERFAELKAGVQPHDETIDPSLWSPERIKAWRSTLNLPSPAPLAILRIPRIRLEVPVLEGTDEVTLNRGVGHIEDTATPGMDGNFGIAGHRDGFFRSLKDIGVGDTIEVETLQEQKVTYRVDRIRIVDPEDVWVLDPTPTRSLTLVTCYPFYFVGSAPKRYIVHAVHAEIETTRRQKP